MPLKCALAYKVLARLGVAYGRVLSEGDGTSMRDRIAELEQQRVRLEQLRLRASRLAGPEGEHLEAQVQALLRDIR